MRLKSQVTYVAAIHRDKEGNFGISFPDFPGCVTASRNLREALEFAQEALALHIEGMVEDGDVIPDPTDPNKFSPDKTRLAEVSVTVQIPAGRA